MIGKLNNANISHRKILLAAKLIRNKTVVQAQRVLQLMQQKSCKMMLKLLLSVIANTRQKSITEDKEFHINDYEIKAVEVGRGKYLNRIQPRAKGSAYPIRKHFSNVTIVIKEKNGKENKS